jgi:aminomethyltransferase
MKLFTPFHDLHLAHGARMQSVRHWWIPSFYSSVDEEYAAVRQRAGVVDYSFQSAIEVRGRDAYACLQKVIVNDLDRIQPGRAIYTNIVEPTARFVDEVVIFWMEQDRFIINGGPDPRKAHLLVLFEEWFSGRDVKVSDLQSCFLSVQGPRSREMLADALGVDSMPFMSVREDRLDGVPVLVARAGYSGELGFEVYARPEHARRLWESLHELGRKVDMLPYGFAATALLAVEKGLLAPFDFYPGSTPLELGLDWTVAFRKPSFHGRDELERRRTQGLLTRLVGFECEDHGVVAAPGTRLYRGARPVGSVTHRNLYGPTIRRNVGRAWVESAFATPGEVLELEYLGERRPVTVSGYRHYDAAGVRMRA